MDIDDAWRDWRKQQTPKKPRRRYIDRRIPVAKLDPAETRRWFIPREEIRR